MTTRTSLLLTAALLCAGLLSTSCDDGDGPPATPTTTGEASAISPTAFGEVEAVDGAGAVESCKGGDCASIKIGDAISVGAGLHTDEVVRASVRLPDDSRMQVDAGTRLSVVDKGQIQLESGRVLLKTPATLSVDTPAGQVEVDRGQVSIRAERSAEGEERTRISVLAGHATLKSGSDAKPLAAGETAVAVGGEVRIHPSASLAYQTAWARDLRVEAEVSDDAETPRGVGNIYGKDPRTKRELPEAISIKSLSVNTTIRGRVARTEIEQIFKNETPKTLEGYYTFPLPPGASIVRFAMEVNGEMMEGEVVEQGRAVKIFDRIVADYIRPRDPALLEWKGGNTFQMRIFPIFGGGEPRIILWYTQTLPADGNEARYTYPLPRTGKVDIDRFRYTADLKASQELRAVRTPMYAASIEQGAGGDSSAASVRFDKEDFSPRQDIVLEWELPQFAASREWVGQGPEGGDSPYFMMVLRPDLAAAKAPAPNGAPAARRDHAFIVDTSFGTAEGDLKAQSAAVATWLSRLGPDDRFTVIAGNQTTETLPGGLQTVDAEKVQNALAFLEGQEPGGATDLTRMFAAAHDALEGAEAPVIVYLGDGHATLGETRQDELLASIEEELGGVKPTIHAVGIGSNVDVAALSRLTRRFGGIHEVLNRGEDVPARVATMALGSRRRTLTQATLTFSSDKIKDVYPRHVPTLRQGEELVVVGRFAGDVRGQVTLTGLVGESTFAQPFKVQLSTHEASKGSFVPRLWAQRHIEHLTHHGGPEARGDIVETSQAHTVMSRYTSFLVLESERMYRQYQVDRNKDRDYWDGEEEAEKESKDTEAASRREEAAPMAEAEPAADVAARPAARPTGGEVPLLDHLSGDGFADASGSISGADADDADLGTLGAGKGAGGVSAGSSRGNRGASKAAAEMAPRPPRKKSKRKSARPTLGKGSPGDLGGLGGLSGGGRRVRRRYVPPKPRASIKSITPQPGAPDSGAVAALQKQIDEEPLRRDFRRRMVKYHLRRGDGDRALEAAQSWLDKDPYSAEAHWRVADLKARAGRVAEAERHFGNAIELSPRDTAALNAWAHHLTLRGDHQTAAAAHRALFAASPSADHALDLVFALAKADPRAARARLDAVRERSDLDARGKRRLADLEKLLAGDVQAEGGKVDLRGAGAVTLRWEGQADLDLSIVLPYGERISADMPRSSVARGKRGVVVAESSHGHPAGSASTDPLEAVTMAYTPTGRYRVEVIRRGDTTAPVEATVAIRVLGQRRTFKVTVPAGDRDVRVAEVQVTMSRGKYRR